MKQGGLKDENIIVFMYDDIANNEENPRPGIIINKPYGDDVYAGVPKVYFLSFVLSLLKKASELCLFTENVRERKSKVEIEGKKKLRNIKIFSCLISNVKFRGKNNKSILYFSLSTTFKISSYFIFH